MPHKDPTVAKAYHQQYMRGYLADPEKRQKRNKVANDRATAIRRWLDAYKLERGCVDCGFNKHPAALHFDHVRGLKALNICNAKSVAQAQREIEKCEVRCANCHAIATFTRLQEAHERRKSDSQHS